MIQTNTPEQVPFLYHEKQCQATVERYDGFVILRSHIPGRKPSNVDVCSDTVENALLSLQAAAIR